MPGAGAISIPCTGAAPTRDNVRYARLISELHLELSGDHPAARIPGETATNSKRRFNAREKLGLARDKQLMTLITARIKCGRRPKNGVILQTNRVLGATA